MPKKNFSDIIHISTDKKIPRSSFTLDLEKNNNEDDNLPVNDKVKPKPLLWVFAVASVLALFFAISAIFAKAEVTITPKTRDISLENTEFTANLNSNDGSLSFQIMKLSGEETTDVQGVKSSKISAAARGSVILYNAYSASVQKFSKNLRLQSTSGKIYRTEANVTLPGYTIVNKEIVPGSVIVAVHADTPGEEYNSQPTDFILPAFTGTAKASKFYARSKGDISGGFSGLQYSITPDQGATALSTLGDKLKEKLSNQIGTQLPKNFIYFSDFTIFKPIIADPVLNSSNENISEKVTGDLYVIIFNTDDLTQAIAKQEVSDYDDLPVTLNGLKDINFSLNDKSNIDPINLNTIVFNGNGQSKLVWNVDISKINDSLIGRPKSDFKDIMANFKNIDKAEVVIRPFWKSSFPDNSTKISIINTLK